MNIDEFLNLSYRELQAITNIDKGNWSKYFNERLSPSWNTLCKASKKLGMEPYELMEGISIKRKKVLSNMSA